MAARGAPSRRMPVMYRKVGAPAPMTPASSTGQKAAALASGCSSVPACANSSASTT